MGITQIQPQPVQLPTNNMLQQIYSLFGFDEKDILQMARVFQQADVNQQGYLTLDDFIESFEETVDTMLNIPIIELYRITPKQYFDKMFFEEWVKGVSTFCLYNKESILRFVYQSIDVNHDEKISKNQIIAYLTITNPKSKLPVFPNNYLKAIENIKLDQSQTISFENFRKINENLRFLCWPALNLQQLLRDRVIGEKFWQKIHSRIEKRQSQQKNLSNKDRLAEENKKKHNRQLKIKIEEFEKKFKTRKLSQKKFKKKIHHRKKGQVSSDTKLELHDTKLQTIILPKINKIKNCRSLMYIKAQQI